MQELSDILYKSSMKEIVGDRDISIPDFQFDSRLIKSGDLFVALKGSASDGHDFIGAAVANGARAIVCEEFPTPILADLTYILVRDSAAALANISANFYGNPAEELQIIGVTGTNGKTTCVTLLHNLFTSLGEECGLISTVELRIGREKQVATHTTPNPKRLHLAFRDMVDAGCEYCFMEVSSHGLEQKRVEGIRFAGALFTNLTHEHLDYHGTFSNYLTAKKKLFDGLGPNSFALVNKDDRNGKVMVQNCRATKYEYSLEQVAEFKGRLIENTLEGIQMEINGIDTWFQLCGAFNAYNLLGVYGVASICGMDSDQILLKLSGMMGVDGRFQMIQSPDLKVSAVVDYAHTPDALKNVLETLRDIGLGAGKLITVVGCGGNRDAEKRPKMALIAATLSDKLILTSDNPRNEDPRVILEQMEKGVPVSAKPKLMVIESREQAINVACQMAEPGDLILVAGKGHETYQEIKGVKYPFDDSQILIGYLNRMKK